MINKKIGLLFPGQGSQSVGMLRDILESYPEARERFHQASDILGLDLKKIAIEGPELVINQTEITQPVLLTASVAIWDILKRFLENKIVASAGHSLGEYSALVVAGVIDFSDALLLVNTRGKLMQSSVPHGIGAMLAVLGLSESKIAELCEQVATDQATVSVANLNTPEQTVIAGEKKAVEKVGYLCKEAGAKRVVSLAVSVPSHCLLMKTAADQLASHIEKITFAQPHYPIYQNFTASITEDVTLIKKNLLKQLYSPVRWYHSVENMLHSGITDFIECGSGRVLTGMMKKITSSQEQGIKTLSSEAIEQIVLIEELYA